VKISFAVAATARDDIRVADRLTVGLIARGFTRVAGDRALKFSNLFHDSFL